MKLIYKCDLFTYTMFLVIVLMYVYNIFVNGFDAFTGISGEQVTRAGGMDGDSSLIAIISSLFAHQSASHLIINLIMFYVLGRMTYDNFGNLPYIVGFFASGIVGNLITLIVLNNGTALGTSGCIFGLIGMLLIASFSNLEKFEKLYKIKIYIAILAITCIFYTLMNFGHGTNIYSHLFGFTTGVVTGFIYSGILKLNKGCGVK